MKKKDGMLLFDLDGTLWDAAEQVAASWNVVRKEYDPSIPPLTGTDLRSVMGRTMDEIADTLFAKIRVEDRREVFHRCEEYEVEYVSGCGGVLYPGVENTLKTLSDAGYKMAVISNCQRGYISSFFASTGLRPCFCDYEEWGRTNLLKAENIRLVMERNNAGHAVYIGDTEGDEKAAEDAGIPFIYASFGYGTSKNPDAVLHAFDELPDVIEILLKET